MGVGRACLDTEFGAEHMYSTTGVFFGRVIGLLYIFLGGVFATPLFFFFGARFLEEGFWIYVQKKLRSAQPYYYKENIPIFFLFFLFSFHLFFCFRFSFL